jgi:hypothetical protein
MKIAYEMKSTSIGAGHVDGFFPNTLVVTEFGYQTFYGVKIILIQPVMIAQAFSLHI